jgi:predicted dienelactone hydrolase
MALRYVLVLALVLGAAAARAADDPSAPGPFKTRSEKLPYMSAEATLEALTVVSPVETKTTPRPVVVVVHGWANNGDQYTWLADHLASRGFVVALYTAPFPEEFDVTRWVPNVRSAIDALEAANASRVSDLHGRLDMSRLGLVGHSYGGATSIGVASVDTRVKTLATFAPGTALPARDDFLAYAKNVNVPLLVVSSEIEYVVPTELYGRAAFELAPSRQKELVQIKGAEHVNYADVGFDWVAISLGETTTEGSIPGEKQRAIAGRYATQWLERWLQVTPDPDGAQSRALVEQGMKDGSLMFSETHAPTVQEPSKTQGLVGGVRQRR